MEFSMSNQTIKSLELLASEFHESRNTAVNGGIKPFGPFTVRFTDVSDLK